MNSLTPTAPKTLAAAVVTTLAVDADPQAREASIFYWERGQDHRKAVVGAVGNTGDAEIGRLAAELRDTPADPRLHHALTQRLVLAADRGPTPGLTTLFDRAWQAEANSRLGYHLGRSYTATGQTSRTSGELRGRAGGPRLAEGDTPEVLVVIPFRDRGSGQRLRNLLACLQALRDQTAPRGLYQVVVVETDERPRWGEAVEPYTDHYLFAHKPGTFNKSWAVNVGVVNAPGRAEIVCILDADVLADRGFVARNAARFRRPGVMGHLSYRDMCCLDEKSTSRAIDERLWRGAGQADTDGLRAFVLRRPPPAAACGSGRVPSTASTVWTSASRAGAARTTTSPTAWTSTPPSTTTTTNCCTCTTRPRRSCARTVNSSTPIFPR